MFGRKFRNVSEIPTPTVIVRDNNNLSTTVGCRCLQARKDIILMVYIPKVF